MFGNIRKNQEGAGIGPPVNNAVPMPRALGLDALHNVCKELYPDQLNPLTVTAIIKYWLGGPDPLDYINMYENPGRPDLGVPPHWHYVSLGLSDLHGDGRLHENTGPDHPSGFGFELTFRLVRLPGETTPPTWPANIMQQLAKYIFNSGNMLRPGDHVSWHSPLGNGSGRITHLLMAVDPQLPRSLVTPHGELSFIQIVGITSEELRAAQHWNGLGLVDLLKTTRSCSPWLVTDINRLHSIMAEDPTVAEKIQTGIEREGSTLSGVTAKCWWVQVTNNDSAGQQYRDRKPEDSDDEDNELREERDDEGNFNVRRVMKRESHLPSASQGENASTEDRSRPKSLSGLHLTFNLEAGSLLPLTIKGRVMHGRHFTFKSALSQSAITFVASSVTGTFVSRERPYVVQGPWLQVLIPDELAARMAHDFQIFNTPEQLRLPRTFSWPEYNLTITIIGD